MCCTPLLEVAVLVGVAVFRVAMVVVAVVIVVVGFDIVPDGS